MADFGDRGSAHLEFFGDGLIGQAAGDELGDFQAGGEVENLILGEQIVEKISEGFDGARFAQGSGEKFFVAGEGHKRGIKGVMGVRGRKGEREGWRCVAMRVIKRKGVKG